MEVWVYVDYREEKGGEMRGRPGHKDNPLLLRHPPGEHGDKGGDPSLQIAPPKILTFIEKNPTLKKVGFFFAFFRPNRKTALFIYR